MEQNTGLTILYTAAEKIDLLAIILRSAESPTLPPQTMSKIARCNAAYSVYLKYRASLNNPEEDQGPNNDDAWLFEDLHVYLRLATRARDKEQLIQLIFEASTRSNSRRTNTYIFLLLTG